MNVKNVVFVNFKSVAEPMQGAERYIYLMAKVLSNNGCDIYVVNYKGVLQKYSVPNERFDVIKLYRFSSEKWDALSLNKNVDGWIDVFEELSPEFIHFVNLSHIGMSPLIAAKKNHVKKYLTVVDHWWFCAKSTLVDSLGSTCDGKKNDLDCLNCIFYSKLKFKLKFKLFPALLIRLFFSIFNLNLSSFSEKYGAISRSEYLKFFIGDLDCIFFLSDSMERQFTRRYKINSKTHTYVTKVPSRFLGRSKQDKLTVLTQQSKVRLGFIGVIDYYKGLHVVFEALNQLPDSIYDVEIFIAGKVGSESYYRGLKSKYPNVKIKYYGILDEDEVYSFYNDVDLIIVPSLCPENQPQVVIEANSLGLPVLISNSAGMTELFGNENNVFEAGDSIGLSSKISHFIQGRIKFSPLNNDYKIFERLVRSAYRQ